MLKSMDLEQIDTIVDVGGGIGFNTAFYSSLNVASVIYLDIDPESVSDAKSLTSALGCERVEFLQGGIEALSSRDMSRSLVVSRDVIEHIYDLAEFFKTTSRAKYNCHNTGAILGSIVRQKMFAELHNSIETESRTGDVAKARDNKTAYLEMRKEYISKNYPEFGKREIDKKAIETRGLMYSDIDTYINNNTYPKNHLDCLYTNTCDPSTGNWIERTLKPSDYQRYAGHDIKLKFNLVGFNTMGGFKLEYIPKYGLNLLSKVTNNEKAAASLNIMY